MAGIPLGTKVVEEHYPMNPDRDEQWKLAMDFPNGRKVYMAEASSRDLAWEKFERLRRKYDRGIHRPEDV
jgi:hypothetical protein